MKSQGLKRLKLPDSPGVYFWKDSKGKILYIGRATSLRDRVRSYFGNDIISTRGSRIVDMVTRAKTVTFEKTDSVLEAIILEANLIKKYQPKYNIDEKDDKSWNYIVITDEEWPRVVVERGRTLEKVPSFESLVHSQEKNDSGPPAGGGTRDFRLSRSEIFGPYPAGGLLKDALKIIRRIFPYLDEKSLDQKHRDFYSSIGLAPVQGDSASRNEYLKNIRNIKLFLEGKKKTIVRNLKKEMMKYARTEEFEKAGRAKRTIYALEHIEDVALIKNDKAGQSGADGRGHFRIEAYDVAHLSGKNVVGVMTVVEDGEPNKDEYRKFKISREKNDDTAALREILLRRLGHPEWPYPSLIVVDGGQAQLNAAQKVLSELKSDIMLVSLVKDEKHKARGMLVGEKVASSKSLVPSQDTHNSGLPAGGGTRDFRLLLSQYKRSIILANSEAHRFAISYHKKLRKKAFLKKK